MDHRVTIVGAGPAGALLAWLLSSRGIDTLLVERQSDFDREFRGEILMPSGLRALEEAGVELGAEGLLPLSVFEGWMNGRPFLRLALDADGDDPRPPAAVSQPKLLEQLVAMAEGTGHFALRRGTTVRRIERTDGGRSILRVRDASGESEIETSFLIGADGRGAVSRRALAPRVEDRGAQLDVVWFKMAYPEAWAPGTARFIGGRGQLLISGATADGLLQMGWVILKGTFGELKSRSHDEWVEELGHHVDPELAAHIRDRADTITRPFLLNAVSDRVVGWATPGALLIGDAAHTMSPVGGQGVNIALRDAIVAANELVPAFQVGGDVETAAARVEATRAREVDLIQRMQAMPPKVMLGTRSIHAFARRVAARVLGTPFGRARASAGANLFLNGVTKVELTV